MNLTRISPLVPRLIAVFLFAASSGSVLAATGDVDGALLPPTVQFSQAHDCQSVDFRPQLGSFRNQGDTGFCFAYSSSDLVHQRTGIANSALDLASSYYFGDAASLKRQRDPEFLAYLRLYPDSENEIVRDRADADIDPVSEKIPDRHPMLHKLEGGSEVPTLLLANTTDLCPEEDLPSDRGFSSHENFVSRLEAIAMNGQAAPGPEVARVIARFRDPVADIFNTGWIRYANRRCHRAKPAVAIMPVSFGVARSLKEYHERMRRGGISPEDRQNVLAAIDFALDHARIAAIGYDLNRVVKPGHVVMWRLRRGNNTDDGDHSSPIVARRRVHGACEYLVRDSSGYDCGDYRTDIGSRCEDHHFWIKESELLNAALYSAVYLR